MSLRHIILGIKKRLELQFQETALAARLLRGRPDLRRGPVGLSAHPPAARVVSLDLPERSVSGWPFVGRRTRGFGHGFLKAEVTLQTACPWGPRGDREEVRFRKGQSGCNFTPGLSRPRVPCPHTQFCPVGFSQGTEFYREAVLEPLEWRRAPQAPGSFPRSACGGRRLHGGAEAARCPRPALGQARPLFGHRRWKLREGNLVFCIEMLVPVGCAAALTP